jgi:predicted MFS family arabinose efflux permease
MVYGLGLFCGTQFAGTVMDRLRREGQFRWRPIFAIPCLLLIGCALACLTILKG